MQFLEEFNGICHIPDSVWLDSDTLCLYTDSSGSPELGCGCFLNGKWTFFPWPKAWQSLRVMYDITFLEMVPVLLALALWGEELRGRNILLYIDNEALVSIINKQTCRSKSVMVLLRHFVLLCMKENINFKASHISSSNNSLADAISRKQWARFFMLDPAANQVPEEIPPSFLSVIYKVRPQDF